MRELALDASVAIKWYFPEVYSEAAMRLLEEEIRWVAPDLLYAEVGNVLWKKITRGEATSEIAEEVLESLLSLDIEIQEARPLVRGAFEISRQFGCTVYDSLYLAAAIQAGCALITADRALCDALAGTPLAEHVLWIEDT